MAPLVERLFGMDKVLGLIINTPARHELDAGPRACDSSTWDIEARVSSKPAWAKQQ